MKTAAALLNWGPETQDIEMTKDSPGPGNIGMVEVGRATRRLPYSRRSANRSRWPAADCSRPAIKLNLHARTNMDVIANFLPVRFTTEERDGYARVTAFSGIAAPAPG